VAFQGPDAEADNRKVLTQYSSDMKRLLVRGYRRRSGRAAHKITTKFTDRGGSIPSNVIERGNNESNSDYIDFAPSVVSSHTRRGFPRGFPSSSSSFLRTQKTWWWIRLPEATPRARWARN